MLHNYLSVGATSTTFPLVAFCNINIATKSASSMIVKKLAPSEIPKRPPISAEDEGKNWYYKYIAYGLFDEH